jgi:ABC-type nitrate/sulfonate/bicarbonate transport system permease component
MTRQHTYSQSLKPIAGAALAGLGIAVLLGSLDLATAQLSHFLGTSAYSVIGVLPSIVPAALQVLQAFAFDYERSLQCFLQMLVSFWPLLAVMAGAV